MAEKKRAIQLKFYVTEQIAEIQKAGVNVNQIARRVNSAGNACALELSQMGFRIISRLSKYEPVNFVRRCLFPGVTGDKRADLLFLFPSDDRNL